MSKKEFCRKNRTIAVYDGLGGIEIKRVDGDYIYCVAGTCTDSPTYHRVKVNYSETENDFIRLCGQRIYLSDCIRV
jgi:hypothetical protein